MYAVKGLFYDSENAEKLRVRDGYLIIDGTCIREYADTLPEDMKDIEVYDYSGQMITPGFSDLHLHASQYGYCGTGMDVALLEWLNQYAYPEETRYEDPEYARALYAHFANELLHTSTTRSCIFATIHTDATLELHRQLEKKGLKAFVGKLNINRNSPETYQEPSTDEGMAETERWIQACLEEGFKDALPMITPRFTPSVTDDYMEGLGKLAAQYDLPCQSHLSENTDEIKWVQELCPDTGYYGETYSRYGLFGGDCPTVMAHCIYCGDEEMAAMKENDVFIAHCPTSNENVIAGIAPAAHYLRKGYNIGLGSDISGGHTLNMWTVITAAIQVSKLRWKYIDKSEKPLTFEEAFYMATAGGGAFFGKVGRFEPGYEFDAVVLKDNISWSRVEFAPKDRLERFAYVEGTAPEAKFIAGRKVL